MDTTRTTTELARLLGPYRVSKATEYLIGAGEILPGQTLNDLPDVRAAAFVTDFDAFRHRVADWLAAQKKKADAQAESARSAAILERQRAASLAHLSALCPEVFKNLTRAEKSPRPKQFEYVTGYFDDADPPGLFLFGEPGTGKTSAAWNALRISVEGSPWDSFAFVKTVELVRLAKSRHLGNDARADFHALFDAALDADFLVLDDFLTEKLSESAEEVVFELLDTRTERAQSTIITSNLCPRSVGLVFRDGNRAKILRRLSHFFVAVDFNQA